jgi:hypothetical protein
MDRGLPEGPISVMMLKTLGKKEWGRAMGDMVDYGLLKRNFRPPNAYMENTAWQKAWKL